MDKLFTLKEAAVITKVSVQTLRAHIHKGTLAYQKAGRQYRVSEQALKDWLSKK